MRLALIASAICKELARRCAAERSWATQELQSLALTYEGWAISMISSSVTTMEAYAVLGSRFVCASRALEVGWTSGESTSLASLWRDGTVPWICLQVQAMGAAFCT